MYKVGAELWRVDVGQARLGRGLEGWEEDQGPDG